MVKILFIVYTFTIMKTKINFLKNFFNWVDMIFIVLNLIIMFNMYNILFMFHLSDSDNSQSTK